MKTSAKLFIRNEFNEVNIKYTIEDAIKRTFVNAIEMGVRASPEAFRIEGGCDIKMGKKITYLYTFTFGVKNNKKGQFREDKILSKYEASGHQKYKQNTIRIGNFQSWDIDAGECDKKYFKKGPPNRDTAAEFLCDKIHASCVDFMNLISELDKKLLVRANNKLKEGEITISVYSGSCI